ncbi:MAG: hypothetical protein IK085_07420 [Clostridia bacterium]|nr:hypothetical protein [Clostridia bacterium]MBR6004807.1 hypothetical protein [Clostridia bacterium]
MEYTELINTVLTSVTLLLGALSKFDITKVDPNSVAELATMVAPLAQYFSALFDKIIKIYQ